MKLRDWMSVRQDGSTKLLITLQRCPNLVKEFYRFKKKIINGFVTDEGNRRGNCHAIETCEYAAAYGLPYVKPVNGIKKLSIAAKIIRDRNQRSKQRKMNKQLESGTFHSYINLGPSGD